MDERSHAGNDILERRLALLRSLAEEIELAQRALLHSDLHAMESHTARQADLCQQLRAGGGQPGSGVSSSSLSSPWQEQRKVLLKQLEAVERRVRHLNRVHSGLLARANQSLAILERVLASSSLTYAATVEENVGARR